MNAPHGTERRYNQGCHCQACRADHATKQKRRRRLKGYGLMPPTTIPAIGAQRRLQALMTLGWSKAELSRRLGYNPDRVYQITTKQENVTPAMHQKVCDLYEQLWNTPAPNVTRGERTAYGIASSFARKNGYASPIAWDDDEIDNPDARPYMPRRAA